jgi:hypothetical protein
MHDDSSARRCLCAVIGGLLLALMPISVVGAGERENIRESYDNALKANEKRIKEIEAKESAIADAQQRADKITSDKVGSARASLKGSGKGRGLVQAADGASGDPSALPDLYREQSEYLNVVTSEWGAEGPERKKLREALTTSQKNLERASASLANAAKAADAVVAPSDVLEKAAQIEATVNDAAERLRARWQLEQAAREREAKQREREAAERARSSGAR